MQMVNLQTTVNEITSIFRAKSHKITANFVIPDIILRDTYFIRILGSCFFSFLYLILTLRIKIRILCVFFYTFSFSPISALKCDITFSKE